MPKVLLDLRMVRGRPHGIGRYALELARRLPVLAPDWEFCALAPPEGLPAVAQLPPALALQPCRGAFLSPFEQPWLALTLAQSRCDLFHATSFSLPRLWPGRLVATLHDANHLVFPEHFSRATQGYYRHIVRPRARTATALVTVSEFSRGELARALSLPPARFTVIANGVDAAFQPPSPESLAAFRVRQGLQGPYFVAVGNAKAHKNPAFLAALSSQLPAPVVLLYGPGAKARFGFAPGTREPGDLPDGDLALLYAGAQALLMPSRYEGFGLPVLEAMASGCPVLASDAGALAELVGPAGVLLGPGDLQGWQAAAARVVSDAVHREALISLGRARAREFTWERCARRTLNLYAQALGLESPTVAAELPARPSPQTNAKVRSTPEW